MLGLSLDFSLDDEWKHGKKTIVNEGKLFNSKKPSPFNVELKHSSNMKNMPSIEWREEKKSR